jgi:hypothetical protein
MSKYYNTISKENDLRVASIGYRVCLVDRQSRHAPSAGQARGDLMAKELSAKQKARL